MFQTNSEMLTRRTALFFAAFACLLALALAPARADASTNTDVKRAMTGLSGGAGAYAWNITDGQGVAARNAGTGRIIASNAKLFTAAAILARYGTGGRFSTGVYTDGTLAAGTLTGDLYLRGGGDPLFGNASFVTTNFGSGATLEKLAEGLKSAGVKTVTGTIFGDESVFDSRRGTVYSGFSRNSDIGGSLGGLMVNKGFVNGRWQANPPAFAAQRLRAALQAVGIKVTSKTGIATEGEAGGALADEGDGYDDDDGYYDDEDADGGDGQGEGGHDGERRTGPLCPGCGTHVKRYDRFCYVCGSRLPWDR